MGDDYFKRKEVRDGNEPSAGKTHLKEVPAHRMHLDSLGSVGSSEWAH